MESYCKLLIAKRFVGLKFPLKARFKLFVQLLTWEIILLANFVC